MVNGPFRKRYFPGLNLTPAPPSLGSGVRRKISNRIFFGREMLFAASVARSSAT